MSLVIRKPVFGVSNQVPHKMACTATENGYRLEVSDSGSRGISLCSENQGTDQLFGYRTVDQAFVFAYRYAKAGFLMMWLKIFHTNVWKKKHLQRWLMIWLSDTLYCQSAFESLNDKTKSMASARRASPLISFCCALTKKAKKSSILHGVEKTLIARLIWVLKAGNLRHIHFVIK